MARVGAARRSNLPSRGDDRIELAAPTKDLPDLHDAEGWLYRREFVDCGKGATGRCRKCSNGPGHGPYWYRYRWYEGKMHKRYVGKRLPLSVLANGGPGGSPGAQIAHT
jgi:hypothetical protein